jgi:eukaryotic-like serine/threonine-protein kinase
VILSTGTTFGPYKIVAPLGRGGMGEVYRASDGRLGRDVALKVLREEDAEDPELLTRFEREARAASSLNHPNIVVVYEAGTASVSGRESLVHYLAMELIDGEPIAASLEGEPMPLRRFLDLATQLADGIARAHESGIVHRDLKPSNVFVTSEGRVKILDFGLAALRLHPGDDTQSPTATGRLTSPGIVVGTLGYMSPEQARGEIPTPASDQFSLGCIFYEMLTGRSAFRRTSVAETFSAILRDEPRPVDEINPSVPQPLRWILERCLAKAPRDRYASTRDLARDLQTIRDHSATTGFRAAGVARAEPRRRSLWIAAAAIAIAAGAAGAILLLERFRTPLQPEFRRLTFREGIVTRALFAPNGSILYAASWEGNPVRSYLALPESTGIDRVLDSDVQFPLGYSKDGSQVLVLVGPSRLSVNESGTLAWWPSLGGRPRRILDNAGWADVAGNGRFLAVVRDLGADRVLELRSEEGALQRTLFRTSGAIWFARISPDDTKVAFVHYPFRLDSTGEIQVAAIDGSGSKVLTRRFERCSGLDWSAKTGEIWFSASTQTAYGSGTLWTVSPSGKLRSRYVLPDFFTLQSISGSGDRFLLTSQKEAINLTVRRGAEDPHDLSWLGWTLIRDISPDGKTALFYDGGPTEKTSGVWIRPLEGGDATRLGEGFPGKFSPDGRWVVAVTRPLSGTPQLILIPVEAGGVRRLPTSVGNVSAPSFAGPSTLLFVRSEKGVREVWTMETDGSGARSLGGAGCDMPIASPSGSSFLCLKGERRRSLFLYSIKSGPGRRLYELPNDGDFVYARWSKTGDRIFGVTRNQRLLTLDSSTGTLLREEGIPFAGTTGQKRLIAAALDAEAKTRAYSAIRTSSDLYLASGIR